MKRGLLPRRAKGCGLALLLFCAANIAFVAIFSDGGRGPDGEEPSGENFRRRSDNELLASELIPGFDGEFTGDSVYLSPSRVTISSQGLRDRELPPGPAPEGTLRIAVVGDSWTFGWGVDADDAFPKLIEQRLAAAGDPPVEVLNFGVPSYDFLSYQERIRTSVLGYEPDVVLVVMTDEDLDLSDREPPSIFLMGAYLVSKVAPAAMWPFMAVKNASIEKDPAAPLPEFWEKVFTDTVDMVEESGARTAFFAIKEMPYRQDLEKILDRPSVCLRVHPIELNSYEIFSPYDTHPNEAGHAIAADLIHDFLVDCLEDAP